MTLWELGRKVPKSETEIMLLQAIAFVTALPVFENLVPEEVFEEIRRNAHVVWGGELEKQEVAK